MSNFATAIGEIGMAGNEWMRIAIARRCVLRVWLASLGADFHPRLQLAGEDSEQRRTRVTRARGVEEEEEEEDDGEGLEDADAEEGKQKTKRQWIDSKREGWIRWRAHLFAGELQRPIG